MMISTQFSNRHAELFHVLGQTRILSLLQIQRLLFPCRIEHHFFHCSCYARTQTAVRRFLRKLVVNGRIAHHKPGLFSLGAEALVQRFILNGATHHNALEAANDYLREIEERIRRRTLQHFLFVNDAFIWFLLSRKQLEFRNRIVPNVFDWALHKDVVNIYKEGSIPDAVFSVQRLAGATRYFIEADRGTEPRKVLQEKLRNYMEYGRFHCSDDKVLFIFNLRRRMQPDFLEFTKACGMQNSILVTCLDQFQYGNAVSGKVWLSPVVMSDGGDPYTSLLRVIR